MKHILPILFLLPWSCAFGQQDTVAVDKKEQTIVGEPVTLNRGILRVSIGTRLQFPQTSFVDGSRKAHTENVWTSSSIWPLFASYGVTDKLMFKVLISYVREDEYHTPLYQFPGNFDRPYSYPQRWRTQARGFGDTDIGVGYQLVTEKGSRPAFAMFVTTTVPTGQKNVIDDGDENDNTYHRPTGQGAVAVKTTLMMRRRKHHYAYSGNLFYIYHATSNKVMTLNEGTVQFQHGRALGGSVSFSAQLNSWASFVNELDFLQFAADKKNNEPLTEDGWLLQDFVGLSFQLKQFRIDQGVTIALIGNNVGADPAYHINLQYSF